jgi:hypothetical protein
MFFHSLAMSSLLVHWKKMTSTLLSVHLYSTRPIVIPYEARVMKATIHQKIRYLVIICPRR